jgi:hypothetical protein
VVMHSPPIAGKMQGSDLAALGIAA